MSDDVLKEKAAIYRAKPEQGEFGPLIDELYRQEVLEARRMPPEEKLLLGERLFRWACVITLEGIRNENPHATETECQHLLRERIALGKRLETL